jgi:hypothetical protein
LRPEIFLVETTVTALRTVLTALLLSSLSRGAASQDPAYSDGPDNHEPAKDRVIPATLYFSNEGGIEEAVPFPETEGDVTVVLICGMKSMGDRDSRSVNSCFAPNDDLSVFEQAFRQGMRSLKVAGGQVDGRRRSLWIPYSVEFSKQGDHRQIRLYQNYGAETSLYGRNYLAPQRIANQPTLVPLTFSCFFRLFRETMWVTANITVDGNAEDVRVLTETSDVCRQAVETHVSRSSFIPAFNEGEPVPAVSLEPFFLTPW